MLASGAARTASMTLSGARMVIARGPLSLKLRAAYSTGDGIGERVPAQAPQTSPLGIRERVREDLKAAFKDKELRHRLSVLRSISTAITYADKDVGKPVDDTRIISLLRSIIEQHNESAEMYNKAGPSYKDKEALELAQRDVVKEYLPAELAPDVLASEVDRIIEQVGAKSQKDIGAVIREMNRVHGNAAPNSLVAPLVKAALAKKSL